MKQFEFVVQDAMGIHARPAADLAAAAKKFTSLILLKKEEMEADLKKSTCYYEISSQTGRTRNDNSHGR